MSTSPIAYEGVGGSSVMAHKLPESERCVSSFEIPLSASVGPGTTLHLSVISSVTFQIPYRSKVTDYI